MIQIETDSFFTMGKRHFICEDYVLTSADGKTVFLSDGCSSSPHTDIGARFLCLCGMKAIESCRHLATTKAVSAYLELGLSTIMEAGDLIDKFSEIPKEALDATLITAFVSEHNSYVYIYMYGDGNIALRFKDGPIIVNNYSFLDSAPYYLNYQLPINQSRLTAYRKAMAEQKVLTHSEIIGGKVGNIEKLEQDSPIICRIDTNNLEMVAIMSDGVESFSGINTEGCIPVYEVITELLNFKTTKGQFVKRTARAAIKRYAKDQVYHSDDLSVAVMLFGEEKDGSP